MKTIEELYFESGATTWVDAITGKNTISFFTENLEAFAKAYMLDRLAENIDELFDEVYTEINCFNDYDFIPIASNESVVQDIVDGYIYDGGVPKTRVLYALKKVSE